MVEKHSKKPKIDAKKILIGIGILFIIVITLAAISDKSSGESRSDGIKMGDTEVIEPEPEELEVGITEQEMAALGDEIDDMWDNRTPEEAWARIEQKMKEAGIGV